MKKLLHIVLLGSLHLAFAQLPESLLKPISPDHKFDEYEGMIYEKMLYKDSNVIYEQSGTSFDAKLRYNIFSDAIEFEKGQNLYELIKAPTAHARVGDDYYYYCEFTTADIGMNKHGYYVLIDLTEDYRIYKKYSLKITPPSTRGLEHGTPPTPGKIRKEATYYLEENGIIVELPTDRKKMLNLFDYKKEALASYAKKEKIKFKKESDLIRFISRYNALRNSEDSYPGSLLSSLRH